MIDYNFSLLTLTISLAILTFWRSILFRRRITEQSKLLTIQAVKFEETLRKLQHNENGLIQEENFQKNLKQAEVTTDLQKTRSSFVHDRNGQRPPERYKYAKSMWHSGMHTDEISSALGMSSNEITQLLKLANIRCNDKDRRENHEMLSPA